MAGSGDIDRSGLLLFLSLVIEETRLVVLAQ